MKHDIPYLEGLRRELLKGIAGQGEVRTEKVAEWHRRPALLVAAASMVVLAGALSAFLVVRSTPAARPPGATGTLNPGNGGGTSTGSCVEPFTQETLAHREFAFDGTIQNISVPDDSDVPTEVTFAVGRWYKGDRGSTITLKTFERPGTITSAGGPELTIGRRLLASGDDDFLWGCGFTLVHTEENERLFEAAFPGD